LEQLKAEVPIKPNPHGVPSQWYMPLVGGEHFFDGFGFEDYRATFRWPRSPLDDQERAHPPRKPLLKFLEDLNHRLPQKWCRTRNQFVPNDDWLLWDLRRSDDDGAEMADVHGEGADAPGI